MADCIFCKIIAKEIPAHIVYEDESVIAFLDLHPVNAGHTLVVPKSHVPHFVDLSEEQSVVLWKAVQKLSAYINQQLSPVRVGVLIAGWDVQHTHVHIVPMNDSSDLVTRRTVEGIDGTASGEELSETLRRIKM